MKKITFFFAGLLMTLSVLASSELTLAPFYAWGEGMHVKDNEVTCDGDKSWQGAQIWLGQDLTDYDYIWMEMNACQGPFELTVEYVSGDSKESVNIESGEYVAYIALDAEKKNNVKKIELKNREYGGSMTIAGIYAGTTAQWQTAMADFREALDFQYFSAWYKATFTDMVLTMTEDYGAGSWWSVGKKSDCYKAVVNFAEATVNGGNLTVTYKEGESESATKSQKDFYDGTTSVEVTLDETLKSNISQIYIQGGETGSTYTFKDAYLMKTPTTPMAVREGDGIRNLGQFKAYNDGLDVEGNTITWNDDKSWKGGDSWIGQDLRDNDYVWMLMDVEGQIKLTLQYGDGSGEEMEVYAGAPYVGFHLNAAKDQVVKLMAQNMTNGGKLVIKGVYAGSEAEYAAMMNRYTTSMNWDNFVNRWDASVNGKTFQMTQAWGAAGWWLDKDYSRYTKVIAEFDGPASISGNLVVAYDNDQNASVGFGAGAHRVEIALDAEKKNVVKQIYFSCETTETNVTLKEVRLLKATDNEIALDENNEDSHNDKVFADYDGFQCNVTLNREFIADDAWYTLCLPFDLNEDQIAASFGECQIMQLTESYMKGEDALYIQFDEVATIEAGKPYLFMPTENLSNISFTGVTINATTPTAYPADGGQLATMTGTYTRPQLTTNQYILVDDNTLAPSDGENWMRAFRAWFELSPSVPAQVKARCVIGKQMPTDLDGAILSTPYNKYVREGKVYILRNGQKYSLMGQTVK